MKIDNKTHFDALTDRILAELEQGEYAALAYYGENSSFMRFNNCKVRQSGTVLQTELTIKLWKGKKSHTTQLGLSGNFAKDDELVSEALSSARAILPLLPDDPYQAIPDGSSVSEASYKGSLLDSKDIPSRILEPAKGLDFTGLYSQGYLCRAAANSSGARHWFETETFLLDYSAWLPNGRAVKSSFAGREWQDSLYKEKLDSTKKALLKLDAEEIVLQPGNYRAFISADALAEITAFFSWYGLGEKGLRQGESAFIALQENRELLSSKFSLTQDFSLGVQPRFNENGELSPEQLALISSGKLENTIVSSRTAKQYNIKANGATEGEDVRSIAIAAGNLAEADALSALGTGVYVSNFHYLNWSDVQAARVTGMTRFSCMWVENGRIVGPIKDMRWDESLYNMLGSKLLDLTKERHLVVESLTYERREVGGSLLPGILVDGLSFTL